MGLAEALAKHKRERVSGIDAFLDRKGPEAEEVRQFLEDPDVPASHLSAAIGEEYPGLVGFSVTQVRAWRRRNGIG